MVFELLIMYAWSTGHLNKRKQCLVAYTRHLDYTTNTKQVMTQRIHDQVPNRYRVLDHDC